MIAPCPPPGATSAARERAVDPRFPPLSRRQAEIATLVSHGETNKMIGRRLGISLQTVKNQLVIALAVLQISNRAALARWVTEVERDGR